MRTNPNALLGSPMENEGKRNRGWSGSGLSVQAGSSQTHHKGLHARPQGSCHLRLTLHMQGEASALREPVLGASKPEELTGVHTTGTVIPPIYR